MMMELLKKDVKQPLTVNQLQLSAALNQVLDRLAIKYGVTSSTIAISWILRYPAKMQAVVGTTNPNHLREVSQAANFSLTRKEWYEIYLAAGNNLP